jgi:hypothetical protein
MSGIIVCGSDIFPEKDVKNSADKPADDNPAYGERGAGEEACTCEPVRGFDARDGKRGCLNACQECELDGV